MVGPERRRAKRPSHRHLCDNQADGMVEAPDDRFTGTAMWMADAAIAFAKREWRLVLLAIGCSLIAPMSSLALPLSARVLVDRVMAGENSSLVVPGIAAGLAILIQVAAAYLGARAGALLGLRAGGLVRRKLMRHVLRLPIKPNGQPQPGSLATQLISDTDSLRTALSSWTASFLSACVMATLGFTILLWLDWRAAVVLGGLLVIGAIWVVRRMESLRLLIQSVSEGHALLAGRLTEAITCARTVKVCAAERSAEYDLSRADHRILRGSLLAQRDVATLGAGITLLGAAAAAVLVGFGGSALSRNAITPGDLAMAAVLLAILAGPLLQVAAAGGELGRAWAAVTRIRALLSTPTEDVQDRGKVGLRRILGNVTFDNVCYGYAPGRPVLLNLNLHVAAGTTCGVLGGNGAGKSTLLALLAGFDFPTSGRILVDDHPLMALQRRQYRRSLGVVLQNDRLLNATIGENIRFARRSASRQDWRRAARLAHCDDFVARLPQGYDTRIGEDGLQLSGGQRQRILIARAFLADPSLLLLDEITAHLDRDSETLINDALAILCEGRTTFIVTHRPAALRRVDQVVLLTEGTVARSGTLRILASGGLDVQR